MSVTSKEIGGESKLAPKSYKEQLAEARRAIKARGITKLAVKGEPHQDGRHVAPVLADTVEVVEADAEVLDMIGGAETASAAIIPIATKNEGEIPLRDGDSTTVVQAIEHDPRGLEILATVTGSTKDNTNPVTLAIVASMAVAEYAITAKDGNGPRYSLGG